MSIKDHPHENGVSKEQEPQPLVTDGEKEQLAELATNLPDLTDAVVHTTTWQFLIIFISLVLCIFCVALDNTIIVTAIPRITDDYQTLNDVGWYGSAFILPSAALVPFFGKIYAITSPKITFLVAMFIFEVGSLISAVAPNSAVFIVGRALSGAGSAGIFGGALIVITMLSPMEKRPAYQSIIGGTYAIATITAPLIGGAFTERVSWRWCFYINLPIGGLGCGMIVLFLHLPPTLRTTKTIGKTLWDLDPIGQLLFLPSIICILLALQWAGTTYAWNSGRIIALMVLFGIFLIGFIAVQIWMGDEATIPPNVISQRTVASVSVYAFLNYAQFFVFVYFIPIYFQAIKGVDAEQSGIDTIPMIVSNNIASLLSGFLTTKFGTYVQYFYASSVLISIGGGLLTTWQIDTPTGNWIGYQIIAGFGTGLAVAMPQVAVQPVLKPKDIPVGISMTLFAQFFGGALFVSVGNNILNTKLVQYISAIGIPDFSARHVVELGATELRRAVPPEYLPQVLDAYMEAIRWSFRAGLVLAALLIIPCIPLEWRSVKPPKPRPESEDSNESSAGVEEASRSDRE